MGFPGDSMVKNLPANAGGAGDTGSIPGPEKSSGGGNSNPFQYSCLENPMDRGAWWAKVRGVAWSWTWLSTDPERVINTFRNLQWLLFLVYTSMSVVGHQEGSVYSHSGTGLTEWLPFWTLLVTMLSEEESFGWSCFAGKYLAQMMHVTSCSQHIDQN